MTILLSTMKFRRIGNLYPRRSARLNGVNDETRREDNGNYRQAAADGQLGQYAESLWHIAHWTSRQ